MARSNPDRYTLIPCFAKILKLLITELDNRIDARLAGSQLNTNKECEDSEEVEDWEDIDENSGDEFNVLSGIMNR